MACILRSIIPRPPFCQKAGRAHIIEICMDPHLSRGRSGSVGRLDAVAIMWSAGSHMMEKRWQMAMSYQEIRVRPSWLEGEEPLTSDHCTACVGRCRFVGRIGISGPPQSPGVGVDKAHNKIVAFIRVCTRTRQCSKLAQITSSSTFYGPEAMRSGGTGFASEERGVGRGFRLPDPERRAASPSPPSALHPSQ